MEIYVDSIEINVTCNNCGKDLEAEIWKEEIVVTPCEFCLEIATNEGRNE